jgi:hypothetical protein
MGDNQYVNFLASQHMKNKKHWFKTMNPIKHGAWGGRGGVSYWIFIIILITMNDELVNAYN